MHKAHPDRQRALWDLNAAINLNPQFSEAMDLKSQVTGKEATASDNSSIHSFVRNRILAERDQSPRNRVRRSGRPAGRYQPDHSARRALEGPGKRKRSRGIRRLNR